MSRSLGLTLSKSLGVTVSGSLGPTLSGSPDVTVSRSHTSAEHAGISGELTELLVLLLLLNALLAFAFLVARSNALSRHLLRDEQRLCYLRVLVADHYLQEHRFS